MTTYVKTVSATNSAAYSPAAVDETATQFINGATIVTPSAPPANATAAGAAGTITWDSGFLYCCIATNTWKRVAIATW